MDRKARQATVHGVAKNQKQLSTSVHTCTHTHTHPYTRGSDSSLGLPPSKEKLLALIQEHNHAGTLILNFPTYEL